MEIRVASVSDARELMNLRQAVYVETDKMLFEPHEYQPTVRAERAFIKRFTEPVNSCLLLAADGKLLVGFLGAMGGGLNKNRHSAQVMLAVRQSHWGRGVARDLLSELVRWTEEDSALTRLSLTVSVNNPRAIDLYQQAGFEIEGTLRKLYRDADGSYHDELSMALLL